MRLERRLYQIRELLASRDPQIVRQGLSRLSEDPPAVAALARWLSAGQGRVKGPLSYVWREHHDWVGLALLHLEGALQHVTALDLSGRFPDLDALSGSPALQALRVRSAYALQDISGIAALRGLRHLTLEGCSVLQDISPLAGLTGLQALELSGSQALEDLSPLAGLTALTDLSLSGCGAVRDLGPLQDLSALARLDLGGCERLERGWAMVAMESLEQIELRRCPALRPRPTLTRVEGDEEVLTWRRKLARGLSRAKDRGPAEEALLAGAKAAGLLAKSAAEAERREARPTAAAIRRLLSARALDDARQGVELLIALDDPAVTADFARGISLDADGELAIAEAVTRRAHLRNQTRRAWTAMAALRAAGALDGQTAFRFGPHQPMPDLTPFSGLAALQVLTVRDARGLSSLAPLADCAALRELSLYGATLLQDLSPLAGLEQLETLEIAGTRRPMDLAPLAALRGLRVLKLPNCYLSGLPALAALSDLREVDLGHSTGVREVRVFKGMRGLEKLNLAGTDAPADYRRRYRARHAVHGMQHRL